MKSSCKNAVEIPKGLSIQRQIILAPWTSWRVGGAAEYLFSPQSVDEVDQALGWAQEHRLDVQVLGGGTNVLISDQGVAGLVICMRKLSGLLVVDGDKGDRIYLSVLAGTPKAELLKFFLKRQLAPALFLAGLPGDVGGGVVMNAGVSEKVVPREFMDIVDWIEVIPMQKRPTQTTPQRIPKTQLRSEYRHTWGWQPGIIVRVGISWADKIDSSVLTEVRKLNILRLSKQPLDQPSCGSVFVNPLPLKAAKLIEDCGLKGETIGGAQVSLKHANFIVNQGGATASDISALILRIQNVVYQKTNVHLQTEVVKIGHGLK